MQCPVCEYPNTQPRFKMKDRFFAATEDVFELIGCPSCGLLFQSEDGLLERLAGFYPPGYWWETEGATSSVEEKYRVWMVRRDQLRFVLSRIPEPLGVRLLDVGCGGGLFLSEAVAAGFDAFGLENSPEAAAIAERSVPGRILQGGIRELHRSGEKFDVVTMFHVLEHLVDPFQFLKAIHRILKRPGTLIVQVPNVGSLQAKLFCSRWYGLDCPRHIYNFSLFSILHLLGRAGFRVHRVRHFSLRDNAAALVSSLFPALDPMSQRVRLLREYGTTKSFWLTCKKLLYFDLVVLSQPLAFLEATIGRGATVSICATLE